MEEEMKRDDRVFLLGEEVAQFDGAYKVCNFFFPYSLWSSAVMGSWFCRTHPFSGVQSAWILSVAISLLLCLPANCSSTVIGKFVASSPESWVGSEGWPLQHKLRTKEPACEIVYVGTYSFWWIFFGRICTFPDRNQTNHYSKNLKRPVYMFQIEM